MIPTTDQIKNQLIPRLKKIIQNSGGGSSTDTSTSSSFKVAVGDNQPVNAALWFDTSDFVSIQGETPTQIITVSAGKPPIIISDTKPAEDNVLWLDTSENSGG